MNNINKANKLWGLAAASLSAISFGVAPILAKNAYAAGCSETTLTFWSMLLAIAPLLTVTLCRRISLRVTKRELPLLLLASASCCAALFLYNSAAAYLPAGSTTALHYLYPALVLLAGIAFFSLRMTVLRIVAVVFNMTGVLLFFERGGSNTTLGSILALASAVCYAVYALSIDKTKLQKMDSFKIALYVCLISAAVLFVYGTATSELQWRVPSGAWTGIALTALTTQFIGIAFFQIGIKRIGSMQTSFASTLEPLTSVVAGVLLFHERITLVLGIGCALICFGIILNAFSTAAET